MVELTLKTFLVACPMAFLGGFIDSIAGGGGLITLPGYMLAGLPSHFAIGTNKISSMMGTSVSFYRTIRRGIMRWKLAIPSIACGLIGSSIGARIALSLDDAVFKKIMLVILPICVLVVLSKKLFQDGDRHKEFITVKLVILVSAISLFVGTYDGFYGPGTGTFLLIGYMAIAKLTLNTSYANMKAVNLASNLGSFVIYILNGKVLIPLGIAAGLCNMLGNYLGSGLALKNGSKIVRPVIIIVVVLLMIKIITDM